MRFRRVDFDRSSLSAREAAQLELTLRLASVIVALRSTGDDDADVALLTFMLGLAAKSFPDVAFEIGATVELDFDSLI